MRIPMTYPVGYSRDKARRSQQGAAAVEFAMFLPLLVVLAFGVTAFGFAFGMDMGVGNGAREGGRYASQHRECAEIRSQATDAAETLLVDPSDPAFTVTVEGVRDDAGRSRFPLCASATEVPCDAAAAQWVVITVGADAPDWLSVPLVLDSLPRIDREGVFLCE